MTRYLRRALVALLIVGIGGGLAAPAGADCVYAQAEVRRWQQSNITLVDRNNCIQDTPWPYQGHVYQAHYAEMPPPLPPGTPNGWQVGVWFPFP